MERTGSGSSRRQRSDVGQAPNARRQENDAEVLAIAAAGAPLDVMAMFLNHTLRSCLTCALKNLQKQLINAPAILHVTGNLKTGKTLQLGQELNLKGEKAMDGFVKTLGVLMVLAAVALWAALIFFVPAALIKFLWLYLVA